MKCTKCNKDFPPSFKFWEKRWLLRGLDGKSCWCKECTRKNDRKRYQTRRRWASNNISLKKQKGYEVDITPEYVESIWPKDNRDPLLGKTFVTGTGRPVDESPTLHKKIPDKGYTMGNVVIVSHLANRIMSNATAKQVQQVGKNMEKL